MQEMNSNVKEVTDSSFQREVLESQKPVLVDFWAEWCGPCRMLAPTVEAVAEENAESATVLKLNVDDNPATPRDYGIKGIPTLILFSGGKEVERLIGATNKETILRMIKKYSESTSEQKQIA